MTLQVLGELVRPLQSKSATAIGRRAPLQGEAAALIGRRPPLQGEAAAVIGRLCRLAAATRYVTSSDILAALVGPLRKFSIKLRFP